MRLSVRIAVALVLSVAFGALFFAAVIRPGLDTVELSAFGQQVELLAPRWLGLVCLLPLLWLFQSGSLVDLARPQRWLSLATRAGLLLLVAAALSRPSVNAPQSRVCTLFLVDVSRSVSDSQLAAAWKHVDAAWKARGDNAMRLLTFADRPKVVPLDEASPTVPRPARPRDPGDHTDIQAAMQYAHGLFVPGMLRRMVLLTDGNETRGDLLSEAYRAAERGVRVHVYPMPERKEKEVLVRALYLPDEVRMGAPFTLTAELYSTHKETVRLTLYKDEFINMLDGSKEVKLSPGRNRVTFRSLVRESGTVNYRLVMGKVANDTFRNNNSASALLPVLGRPKVLYIEGEPTYAGYLRRALEAEKIDVTVRGPHGLPGTAAAMAKFDLVLLSDVPAMYVGPGHMSALHAYVRDLGGGFIMAGGPNAFGSGGYYGTRLERILPVRFDTEKKRDQPSLALVLCIDRSGSMRGMKLELAKDAAKATAELLGRSDLIGVVAFDARAHNIVRLQRAANRLKIIGDISALQSGGGTNIFPALRSAYSQLQSARAKVKHVILLSDGQSSYGGIDQLVGEMTDSGITVSAVGVGNGADRTLLQMIAERGGGRFYFTDDPRSIPKIFTKETTQVARSALVEEAVVARVAKMANVIRGIDWSSAPPLRGYVSTKAKPRSETILVSGYGEPLLSMWRVGLGKTAAFTSDVKNRWAAAWLNWRGYQQFWAQLVREVMRHRIQKSFDMRATVAHGRVEVTVDALDRRDRFINGLSSTVTVLDPVRGGLKRTFAMRQTAAGRYTASFDLPRHGSLLLRADHRADGKLVAQSLTPLAAPYPEEYVHLVPNRARVARAASVAGGKVDPPAARLFSAEGEKIDRQKDLWPWLLYVLLGLFVVDVLLRRVRIFGYRR